jgi:hypothetical protein
MLPFWFGTVAGAIPWIAIWFNVITADEVPGFVYGIVVAETVLFFSFGLNQWLQYRRVGRWTDYLYGEKTYPGPQSRREVAPRMADLRWFALTAVVNIGGDGSHSSIEVASCAHTDT